MLLCKIALFEFFLCLSCKNLEYVAQIPRTLLATLALPEYRFEQQVALEF